MRPITLLNLRNFTVSSVFWISGIFSFKPVIRLWRFISMNWYFLYPVSSRFPQP